MADEPPIVPLEITITKRPSSQPPGAAGNAPAGPAPSAAPLSAPVVPDDEPGHDLGADYVINRQRQSQQDMLDWQRRKYGVPGSAPGTPEAAATPPRLPASPTPNAEGEGGGQLSPTTGPRPTLGVPPSEPPPQGEIPADLMEAGSTGRFLRGAGSAVVHAPRAVLSGVGSAGRELFEAADSLGTWLNENVADLRVAIPKTGSETLDQVLADPASAIARAIAGVTPDTPDAPLSPFIKDTAQFLAGMIGGGRILKDVGLALTGTKAGLAAGAVSDALFINPNDPNLAKLLNDVPGLDPIVPDFLATSPDDNQALNRLRRSVEGLGLGLGTNLLIDGLRAFRAARAAGRPVATPAMQLEQQFGKVAEADLAAKLGDPTKPIVTLADRAAIGAVAEGDAALAAGRSAAPGATMTASSSTARAAAEGMVEGADDLVRRAEVLSEPKPGAGPLSGGRVAINWAAIATGDDVKVAMRDMADHFNTMIDAARRGRISQEETQALASELKMSVDDLLNRRQGQAFNAEEALAARQLLTMAGEKLIETARAAAAPNAGALDLFAFRRAVATEAAIAAEVMGARAEAGRALNAWKIPASAAGDVERSKAILEALSAAGGDNFAIELASRLSILNEAGAPLADIIAVARKSALATSWDAVREVWVNGLLSNPATHIVNTMSNSAVLAQQVYERGLAARVSELTGSGNVAPGEASAMIAGIVAAQKDAFRMFWLALRSGESGHALGKVDVPHPRAFTAEAFNIQNDALAKSVDFLGNAARVPSRLLGAEDEYFKTIGYRMELNAQAVRQATSEGLVGQDLRERIAKLVSEPTEAIRLQAADAALYMTFTQRSSDAASALLRLREAWPALMYVIPFVRTPINILHYTFERTPLAPLMSSFRDDMAAGGARAELARARMATGTAIMLLAADYADRGVITGEGPKEPGKREALQRQGVQQYSIRVGDRWVNYSRMDPYGMLFGFAATMAEVARRGDMDNDKLDEFSEILAAGITAVAATAVNKTYMRGMADLVWTIEDPQRKAFGYVGTMMGSFVPSGINAMKSFDDPVLRENFKAWDYVQGRLLKFSESMQPALDLWGAERRTDTSGFGKAYDVISPVRVTQVKESPIDAELIRLDLNIERIDKRTTIDGVPINFRDWPEVYTRYVQLAGNLAKSPVYNLGAKDFLDQTVSGRGPMAEFYKLKTDGPEGGKAQWIKQQVFNYRKIAAGAILADPAFPDFQAAWREERDAMHGRRRALEGVPVVPTPNIDRPMPSGAPPVGTPSQLSPMSVPR